MGDMPRWDEFVQSVLSGKQQDKPDKTDKATFVNKLTSKKENIERKAVEKNE